MTDLEELNTRVSKIETTLEFLKRDQEELDFRVDRMSTKEDLKELQKFLEDKVLPEVVKFNSYVNKGKGAGLVLAIIGSIITLLLTTLGDTFKFLFN
jgi:hypothetical protein